MRQALQFPWVKLCGTLTMPSTPGPLHLLCPSIWDSLPPVLARPASPFGSQVKCHLLRKAYPGHPSITACTRSQLLPDLCPGDTDRYPESCGSSPLWASWAHRPHVSFTIAFPVSWTVLAHDRCSVNNTRTNEWERETAMWRKREKIQCFTRPHFSSPNWDNLDNSKDEDIPKLEVTWEANERQTEIPKYGEGESPIKPQLLPKGTQDSPRAALPCHRDPPPRTWPSPPGDAIHH